MSVETFQTLSIIFYTLAGVMFLAAFIMFFVLGIPKAFGMYTGLSAKKGIKKYQQRIQRENTAKQTEKTGITSPVAESTVNSVTVAYTDNHTAILTDRNIKHEEPALTVVNNDAVFTVIQELSFTGSAEFIE